MPNSDKLLKLAERVVCEIDHFGRGAPFVAYVNVTGPEDFEHVFITRGDGHPVRPESSANVQYVRYRLPLGRIAETKPGDESVVRVPKCVGLRAIPGQFHETTYTVLSRNVFRLKSIQDVLEAFENQITFPDGTLFIQALRRWIARTHEEIVADVGKPLRRRLAETFSLAGIPVVDNAQGNIWRLPIHRFIVIAGAPGTGKTTTAIGPTRWKYAHGVVVGEIVDAPTPPPLINLNQLEAFSTPRMKCIRLSNGV